MVRKHATDQKEEKNVDPYTKIALVDWEGREVRNNII